MKLIASLTSPYARKVRIVLLEKKVDCPLEIHNPWDDESQVPSSNPLGKVPVLVLDDGSVIYDSRVIVEYLDNSSPVSRLLPQEKRSHIIVKRWEALADGICDAAAAIVIERRRPEAAQYPPWIVRQQQKIDKGLHSLSTELAERLWCHGNAYSLADIAVGVCLGYLDLRFPEINWREHYPNLEIFSDRLNARQSFIDTHPPAI